MPKGQRIKPEQIVMLLRQVEVLACPARFERATYGLEGVKIYLKQYLGMCNFFINECPH